MCPERGNRAGGLEDTFDEKLSILPGEKISKLLSTTTTTGKEVTAGWGSGFSLK